MPVLLATDAPGGGVSGEYVDTRRIMYDGGAQFVPVCETCHRFVKADPEITLKGGRLADQPNATCSQCGRTKMLFEGFFDPELAA